MVGDFLPGTGEIVEMYQSSGESGTTATDWGVSISDEFFMQTKPVEVFWLGRLRFQLSAYDRILVTWE